MESTLHIATYNIHKGFSRFNLRMTVHEMRDRLSSLGADLVFLQEVLGNHSRHAARWENWPSGSQYEFLADNQWINVAYGKNAVYDTGHHGNAILSRYPIVSYHNEDISTNPRERRGLLHAEVAIPGYRQNLHCLCVHLDLTARGRRKQFSAICDRVTRLVPESAPLILAGDFNDWRMRASRILGEELGLHEVFETAAARAVSLPGFRCCGWTASMCAASGCATRACTAGRSGRRFLTTRCSPRDFNWREPAKALAHGRVMPRQGSDPARRDPASSRLQNDIAARCVEARSRWWLKPK